MPNATQAAILAKGAMAGSPEEEQAAMTEASMPAQKKPIDKMSILNALAAAFAPKPAEAQAEEPMPVPPPSPAPVDPGKTLGRKIGFPGM